MLLAINILVNWVSHRETPRPIEPNPDHVFALISSLLEEKDMLVKITIS